MQILKNLLKLGIPPFFVWSGPPKSEEPNTLVYGHKSLPSDELAAINTIADLTDYGNSPGKARVVDSQEKIVLDMTNPQHVEGLKALRRERDGT